MGRAQRELSQDERLALELLAANESSAVGQRARAILTWDAKADLELAAEAAGLRPAQVRHWVQAFARLGLRALAPGTSTIGGVGRPTRPPRGAEPAPAAPPAPRMRPRPAAPRIRATDPIVEAIRRILLHHFGKAKKLEQAAFEADEEAIHDMRVSIRRLRAALRIARPFFRPKRLEGVRTRLQEAAEVLGAVRDLDVILAHAQAYAGRQPEGGPDLDGWLDTLRSRRAVALEGLREYLAGKRFRRLRSEVQAFLAGINTRRVAEAEVAAVAGAAGSVRVRDVLPAALWAQYSTVRAHEMVAEPTPELLHSLRIEFKRLRYLMEFFQGVLGARAIPAIELAVGAQDHLGRLNDAWVAAGMLRSYIGEAGSPDSSGLASAAAYLADLHREVETLTQTFPPLWQEITSPLYRRRLARLLARV
jgi:CHAD domain-containing protein